MAKESNRTLIAVILVLLYIWVGSFITGIGVALDGVVTADDVFIGFVGALISPPIALIVSVIYFVEYGEETVVFKNKHVKEER